jgi:hypothetical protein
MQHREKSEPVAALNGHCPRIGPIGLGMTFQIEHMHKPIPISTCIMHFIQSYGLMKHRRTTVLGLDDPLERGWFALSHGACVSTSSPPDVFRIGWLSWLSYGYQCCTPVNGGRLSLIQGLAVGE